MDNIIASFKADADISANYLEAVKMSAAASFEVGAITGTTDKPIGILQNEPKAAGEAASVCVAGVCKARYGGTVDEGNDLTVDADGELVAATPGTDTTRYVIARALEAGVDQDVKFVLVGLAAHRAA